MNPHSSAMLQSMHRRTLTRAAMAKKNILMILVDEERMPRHFPAGISFPAREWLRAHGLSFERYYVNTAPCTPSRSVIFTGWHTPRNGMVDNTPFDYVGDMDPSIGTLGDMAARAGYYSAYKGKWHLANIAPSENPRVTTEDAMRGYGFFDFQHDGDLQSMAREGYTHDGHIAADAIHWLNRWINYPEGSTTQPFFLVCSFVNPHDVMAVDIDGSGTAQQQPAGAAMPVMSPPSHEIYTAKHGVALCASWQQDFNQETHDNKPSAHREFDRLFTGSFGNIGKDAELWKKYVDYYINCQRDVDRHIMSLLEYLEQTGLVDETIVIFTSDHGEAAGAHGLRTKGPFMYEETTNVPLIICHPDGRKGETTSIMGAAIDIAPTLMGLVQLAPGERESFPHLTGHDLSPVVFDSRFVGPRDAILYTYTSLSTLDADYVLDPKNHDFDPSKRGLLLGVRTATHKFVRYFSPLVKTAFPNTIEELRAEFDLELYDLVNDIDEITNLALAAENDELMLQLNDALNALVVKEIVDVSFPTTLPDDFGKLLGPIT